MGCIIVILIIYIILSHSTVAIRKEKDQEKK